MTPRNNSIFASDSVLYYPNIEFLNDSWLKAALTLWDTVYRIVPSSYNPQDSDEVRVAVEAGLVKNVVLSKKDLEQTATSFEDFCEGLLIRPAGLEGWSNIDVNLHSDKVDARIRPLLQSLANRIDPDGWLSVSPEVGHGYMLFLSDNVSKNRNMPKLTDNVDMYSVMTYFSENGQFDEWLYSTDAREVYSTLMIQTIVPASVEHTPIDKVVKLSKKHREAKAQFRVALTEFSEKISKCEDPNFTKDLIVKFKKDYLEAERRRSAYVREFFNNTRSSILYVGIPTLMTTLVTALGEGKDIFDPKQIISGCALSAVASFAAAGEGVRARWQANKGSYYLRLLETLGHSTKNFKFVSEDLTYKLNEFIND